MSQTNDEDDDDEEMINEGAMISVKTKKIDKFSGEFLVSSSLGRR